MGFMVRAQGEADGEFAKLGFKSEINIEFFDLLIREGGSTLRGRDVPT